MITEEALEIISMFLKRVQRRFLLFSCIGIAGTVGLLAGSVSSALAGYVPPADADAPTSRSTSGGRRGGCQAVGDIDLIALAPQYHVGQTASSHPTLTWFVPEDTRQPLELELYEQTSSGQWQRLNTLTLEEGPAGLMTFTWPESEPGLMVGRIYRWQVVSTCVVGLPSRDLVTTAELQVVAAENMPAVAPTAPPLELARNYAEAGLWYDALAIATSEPLDPELTAYRDQLLTDLAALEAASTGSENAYLTIQLLRIVAEQ